MGYLEFGHAFRKYSRSWRPFSELLNCSVVDCVCTWSVRCTTVDSRMAGRGKYSVAFSEYSDNSEFPRIPAAYVTAPAKCRAHNYFAVALLKERHFAYPEQTHLRNDTALRYTNGVRDRTVTPHVVLRHPTKNRAHTKEGRNIKQN